MTREDIEKKMHESAEEIKPLVTTLVEALCEAHQKGYLAGVELGAKMAYPHWIPVEERLPEERKVVWVRKHFNKEVLGEFDIYDSAAFCNGEFQCDNSCNVTHWMEIVPPRKEEKE